MDLFPFLGDRPPIKIPYVCTDEYDNQNFFSYPQRKGWDKELAVFDSEFQNKTFQEVQSLLQTWLYFGMLCEVLGVSGVKVDINDFIDERASGERFVSTIALPRSLRLWKTSETECLQKEQASATQRSSRPDSVYAILEEVCMWVNRFCMVGSKRAQAERGFKPPFGP